MTVQGLSYNCRGLRLGQSAGDRAHRRVTDNLLDHCDILCLQETFLSKQDIGQLSSLHPDFHGAEEAKANLSRGMVSGRTPGGVAILWRKQLDQLINVIRVNADWCIAINFKHNNKEFVILKYTHLLSVIRMKMNI